ncbi:MAG: Asp-tRNA(Asn)/Glu-tRNA(Gln) amidotransferase subunit GatC [Coriobacteriia bacterium]|nr:Asp-tRNA(Asn)/Glu-tRNA(Gln) amidotransferase subunit GatC [Coriobacteriia bacterium]
MYLSEKDVRDIAAYTRIGLPDEEVAAVTVDLNNIIEGLKPITEFDLQGVEPTFHPLAGLVNVMRDDVAKPGLSQEEALANAAAHKNGQFLIPPILAGGGE